MGSTGVGSGNYQIPKLANAVLGTKFKLVTGYPGGGDINLAIRARRDRWPLQLLDRLGPR
jgi:hypothetical protein